MPDNNRYLPETYTDNDGNEIRFYVSKEGDEVGVSKRGLAVLCGVSHSTFIDTRYKFSKIFNDEKVDVNEAPECLRALIEKGLPPVVKSGNDGDFVVTQPYAIATIKEYAINRNNKKAMLSLTGFAERGFVNWVKDITGYQESGKDTKALEVLLEMMTELKAEVLSIKRINANTVAVFENMPTIQQSTQMLALGSKPFTLTDWLVANEIDIDDRCQRQLRLRVAESYKTLTGKLPKKVTQYGKTSEGKATNTSHYLYHVEHDGMIRAALYRIISDLDS